MLDSSTPKRPSRLAMLPTSVKARRLVPCCSTNTKRPIRLIPQGDSAKRLQHSWNIRDQSRLSATQRLTTLGITQVREKIKRGEDSIGPWQILNTGNKKAGGMLLTDATAVESSPDFWGAPSYNNNGAEQCNAPEWVSCCFTSTAWAS